ncbi:unnamed protein product [Psylliodes chrysocephalus]|uniref:Uncharacterized protein n=1 Tax=Psylliodes chrysocephalus TaxID=3402493 RepID=A0A9P0CUP2_9CUCU|nr:unnamed protein product [Psylliodes chrysocephala]
MSIVIDCQWSEPLTNTPTDIEAADRLRQFECGLYFHPIYVGDWPQVVKERIAQRSQSQGLPKSRLPSFSQEEIAFIKGTQDYLGLNHYFTCLVSNIEAGEIGFSNYEYDIGVIRSLSPNWRLESNSWAMVPYGVRRTLDWINTQYNKPDILITEMGMADDGTSINDDERIKFFTDYTCNILDAMYTDGVTVLGMAVWSLMDNFEWASGYTAHFGLYHIDFYSDPTLKREPKKSVGFFRQLIKTRTLPCNSTSEPIRWIHKQKSKKHNSKHNSKHQNSKHHNSKHHNSKHHNSEHHSAEHQNSKHHNAEHQNSKHHNSEHHNSEHHNSEHHNSEHHNSEHHNSEHHNLEHHNSDHHR